MCYVKKDELCTESDVNALTTDQVLETGPAALLIDCSPCVKLQHPSPTFTGCHHTGPALSGPALPCPVWPSPALPCSASSFWLLQTFTLLCLQIAKQVTEAGQESFLSHCPACQAPVPVSCLGGHTTRALPCCSATAFSCGAACQQPLSCGNHACSKPCHALMKARASGSQQGMLPFSCGNHVCSKACHALMKAGSQQGMLPLSCGNHVCSKPCHALMKATASGSQQGMIHIGL